MAAESLVEDWLNDEIDTAVTSYVVRTETTWIQFLEQRRMFYAAEKRWQSSDFWTRRI
jgi:hypothetical protein